MLKFIIYYTKHQKKKRKPVFYYDAESGMMRKYTEKETKQKENDGRPLYCASSLVIKNGIK